MTVKEIQTQRALSPTNNNISDFVINPYKGCGFGCDYCYAQSNKAVKKIGREWGSYVFPKVNFIEILKKDIQDIKKDQNVMIGTATEVFQYAETKYRLTEQTLEILKHYSVPFILLSKSPLILNCEEDFNYHPDNTVIFTVNSGMVHRLFEKSGFPQNERFEAVKELCRRNIRVTVYVGPVFPYLTDIGDIMSRYSELPVSIQFEALHPVLGNIGKILPKLPEGLKPFYCDIFENSETYESWGSELKKTIASLSEKYGIQTDCFVHPFGEYYNERIEK